MPLGNQTAFKEYVPSSEPLERGTWKCAMCFASFPTLKRLKKHKGDVHSY